MLTQIVLKPIHNVFSWCGYSLIGCLCIHTVRTHAHYTVKITKSSLVYQFQFYNLLLLLIYENIKLGHRDSISQQVLTAGL